MENYDAIPAVRRSSLWLMNKSPAHYQWAVNHPEEPTKAKQFGIAAHKYILQPGVFLNEYAVAPKVDRRTKEGKEAFAAFMDRLDVRSIVEAEDYETIKQMDEAIQGNEMANELLNSFKCKYETIFVWTDDLTGEPCKCRTDCLTEYDGKKYIVDYKTADSCEDGHFEWACRKYGYQFQAGMYREGVFQSTSEEYGFVFVAQEKKPPYAVRVYFCTEEFINQGYYKFRELIGLYHMCRESGTWPGYPEVDLVEEAANG